MLIFIGDYSAQENEYANGMKKIGKEERAAFNLGMVNRGLNPALYAVHEYAVSLQNIARQGVAYQYIANDQAYTCVRFKCTMAGNL